MTKKIQRAWFYVRPHTKPGPRQPGPHGVTLSMIELSTTLTRRRYPNHQGPRDRSLRGKARRNARKALQRRPLDTPGDW